MTMHVPLVGLLGGSDLSVCLVNEPLRSGKVGVSSGIDVPFRLRKGESAGNQHGAGDGSKNDGTSFHVGNPPAATLHSRRSSRKGKNGRFRVGAQWSE
jgi:hypothetical protein